MQKGNIGSFFLIAFLLLTLGTQIGYSQGNNPDVVKNPLMYVQKVGTVNLAEAPDSPYQPMMYNTTKIHVQGDPDREQYLAAKERANQRRDAAAGEDNTSSPVNKVMSDPPVQGVNFFANTQDGIPLDNAIAVSKAGFVVSATNSKVQIYDEDGTTLLVKTLAAFFSTAGSKFDPKITYDPDYDRFILLYLNGSNHLESKVMLAFSETNDPTGNWNVYAVPGNADPATFGNRWTDFCQIGLSTHEFFFCGNLFPNDGVQGSTGRMTWQVDKSAGYDGDATLPIQTYASFGNTTFAMCPAEGSKNLYGPNMYFVSTLNAPFATSSTVWLHEITDTIGGNPQFNTYPLSTFPNYSLSPNGRQKDTNIRLDVRDCRVRSAYYHADHIVFGMNSESSNRTGIYVGEISGVSTQSFAGVTGQNVTIGNYDISFPGLAFGGKVNANTGNLSTLLFFNFASTNDFPGNGAVIIDEDGVMSTPTVLKEGFTYIDGGDDPALTRWGDYSTADWRHTYAGEIWVAGYIGYSSSNHDHGTWVSQLFIPDLPAVGIQPPAVKEEPVVQVYPNPTTEFVKVEFDVPSSAVYTARFLDAQGKEIDLLDQHHLYQGKARLTFYTDHLSEGMYFLEVSKDGEPMHTEKVMVAR